MVSAITINKTYAILIHDILHAFVATIADDPDEVVPLIIISPLFPVLVDVAGNV